MKTMKHSFRAHARQAARGCRRSRALSRAFSLLETLLTTIIVGLAITALVKQVFFTAQQNAWTQRVQIGSLLADNVREMMAALPFNDPGNGTQSFGPESGEKFATFNDVDDFDGFDSNVRTDLPVGQPVGVVDAARRVIVQSIGGLPQVPPEWKNWRQQIAVDPVDPMNLNITFPKPQTSRVCVRVTVTISYQAPGTAGWQPIVQVRWIKAR
jgi:hypothetical protein